MKYVFVFLVIYLLATSFAAHGKSKMSASEAAHKQAVASLKRLSTTKLGKTLIDTIQIELKSNSGDPRPLIIQLLQEILEETLAQIDALNVDIQASRAQHAQEQSQLNDEISGLQTQIADETAEQAQVTIELGNASIDLEATVELIGGYREQLSGLVSIRAQRKASYEKENTRLTKIRNILEQLRSFISDRLNQRQNPSFLQRNNVLVEIKRKVMSKEFQEVSGGWGKLINFLATKALAKLKENPDEQAERGLSNIIEIVDDSLETIRDTISDRNNAEEAENAAYEEAKGNLEENIATTSAQEASLELRVSLANSRLVGLAAALEQNNALLESKQVDLQASVASGQQKEDEYSVSLSTRNQEVDIIREVQRIFNNGLINAGQAVDDSLRDQ